eukprot:TRINITY_DN6361_c0_g1_i2.p3 TRINITY_DN6361_c0_g1~~TRINITY_DN6361_c0_g1_i2.p3  ORF type:complete len:145 (+),score=7.29 TRINITY_DN6361_c0_g1_i2:154-588(+)
MISQPQTNLYLHLLLLPFYSQQLKLNLRRICKTMITKLMLFLIFLRKNVADKDVLSRQGQVIESRRRLAMIDAELEAREPGESELEPVEREEGTSPGVVVYGTRRLAMIDAELEAREPAPGERAGGPSPGEGAHRTCRHALRRE